ncbi:hypothetical protein Agub_g15557, partial [Astrephomene gubernaculifera]
MRHANSLAVPAADANGEAPTARQQLAELVGRRSKPLDDARFDTMGGDGYLIGIGAAVHKDDSRVKQVETAVGSMVKWYATTLPDVGSWSAGAARGYGINADLLGGVLNAEPTGAPKARHFSRAEAPDEEMYHGSEYNRQRRRVTCWAAYKAEVTEGTGAAERTVARTYVAHLKYFVHLPGHETAKELRFAVADVYSAKEFSGGLVVVDMDAAATAGRGSTWEMWRDFGIPLSELK